MQTNPQPIVIRHGTAADGEILSRLVSALADYEKLPRPQPDAIDRLARDAFGPAPRFDTWFAEAGGVPAGYAITFFTYSTFLALPTLYLEDLFVLPEYRALGAGRKLFLACAGHGYRNGCGRMEWQVLHWNTPAIEFYRRMGAAHQDEWLPYRLTRDQLAALIGQ